MLPELVDTHCHLTFKELADRADEVILDAVQAGVTRMITVVCHHGELSAARELRRRHPSVWIAAGVHPHEAGRADDAQLAEVAGFWRDPACVAAGEMGLDYHYDFSPRDVQQQVFRKQLELAAPHNLPIVIHCREAHDDVVRLLLAQGYEGRPVVFHCFSGDAEQAAEIRSHGWRVSFTGVITFKNASAVCRACIQTPLDEILFETDAPYLSPAPMRKIRPNEPKLLVHPVRFAAELRGESYESLAAASTANAVQFFGLK